MFYHCVMIIFDFLWLLGSRIGVWHLVFGLLMGLIVDTVDGAPLRLVCVWVIRRLHRHFLFANGLVGLSIIGVRLIFVGEVRNLSCLFWCFFDRSRPFRCETCLLNGDFFTRPFNTVLAIMLDTIVVGGTLVLFENGDWPAVNASCGTSVSVKLTHVFGKLLIGPLLGLLSELGGVFTCGKPVTVEMNFVFGRRIAVVG